MSVMGTAWLSSESIGEGREREKRRTTETAAEVNGERHFFRLISKPFFGVETLLKDVLNGSIACEVIEFSFTALEVEGRAKN